MISSALLWVPFTLCAIVAQTFRNAVQSKLTAQIGTVAATQVRFIFGLPFAIVFLVILTIVTREIIPSVNHTTVIYILAGALSQILATAFMLMAMQQRGFSVAYAYIKTEPVVVALFSVLVLGEHLSWVLGLAVALATLGVLLASIQVQRARDLVTEAKPILTGLAAGGLFGASAVNFRGAITHLAMGSFYMRATTVLVWSLAVQCIMLAVFMLVADRKAFGKTLSDWRQSFSAGGLGTAASLFWFTGFALTSATNVRTLALLEVILAAVLSRQMFKDTLGTRKIAGMALIVLGVAMLLRAG